MVWDTDRKARLPKNWEAIRQQVKVRAGGRCEWVKRSTGKRCGNFGTDCDHIVRGDDHRPEACQWLCTWHHRQKTAAEANDARKESQARARRPERKHPGLR